MLSQGTIEKVYTSFSIINILGTKPNKKPVAASHFLKLAAMLEAIIDVSDHTVIQANHLVVLRIRYEP